MIPEVVAELGGSQLNAASSVQPSALPASYNFSLADVARFEQAYNGGVPGIDQTQSSSALKASSLLDSPAMRAVMDPLNRVNTDAMKLAEDTGLMAADGEMSPGQMIMLTVRCQEFLFHCEMTSNVANRTSDGFQQLFRQQS
jgi:hypothetical protein